MKTGLERAVQIEPNSFAYFLKMKEYLTAGSTEITAINMFYRQGVNTVRKCNKLIKFSPRQITKVFH